MKTYLARITGWVAGRRVEQGDPILLSEAAAQHEAVIEPPPAAPAPQGSSDAPVANPVKPPRKGSAAT